MKKLLFLLTISLGSLLSALSSAYAQTIPPPYINYQAVLYDVNGANPKSPLINQSFTTFVNINDELGNLLYREEHYASTDANGLITVKMGDGLYTAGPITNFNLINWGVGKYYLVVDFDINGTISSTAPEQLVTVPYSFYAGNAGNGMTAVADNGNGTLTFTYANGATYTTPTLSGIQGPAGPVGPSGASGTAGQSAYDLWLGQGNTGTEQEFLNTLVGPQGIQGLSGESETNGGTCFSCPTMISNVSNTTMTLVDATNFCSNLIEGGFNNWRLPSLNDYEYIRDHLNLPVPNDVCWTKDYQITGSQQFIYYYKISTVRGVIGYDFNGAVLWKTVCVR